jgi:hypothetical protein
MDIEVESQGDALTCLVAECEKCGARVMLNVPHSGWTTGIAGDAEPWEEAVDRIDTLLEELEGLPEAADDFASSAESFLSGVRKWAKKQEHITDAQVEGIDKWEAGLEKWRR